MAESNSNSTGTGLRRYVTPLMAWALAFGSAVGWGAFVMPGTTFLPVAGPLGAVLGLAVGAVVMLVIAVNYHFLMNRHPGSGGTFTFTKSIFGYDHGFLCAWFLALAYIAIIWANATALSLIGRSLLGNMFQFGPSYQVAGFSIYFGEVALGVSALMLAGFACLRGKLAGTIQVICALVLLAGVVVCFGGANVQHMVDFPSLAEGPLNGNGAVLGFLNIVALAPWAYIGFESIAHSSGEFRFSLKKSFAIMAIALATAGIAYSLLAIMAASAQPQGFHGWADYLSNLGALSGIQGIPTFFAAEQALGSTGATLIGITALGAITTGLIGNYVASSRLLFSMAKDNLLPTWFARLNSQGVPANAILFIMAISLVIPFMGRTAISWIVDVTTVGAAIAYAYASACALKEARKGDDRLHSAFGLAGLVISLLFLLWFLVPSLLEVSTLSTESYLILAGWSILGFAFFRHIFKKDKDHKLGHSTVAWTVLFFLILFTSTVWANQVFDNAAKQTAQDMQANYQQELRRDNPGATPIDTQATSAFIQGKMERMEDTMQLNELVQMGLIVVALVFLFSIYSIMQKRQRQTEVERVRAEEVSRAKTSFLSNMSHEIRTPMNAIIGLDNIALKEPDLPPRTREQLEKIGASARHLLGLINDILDMSRIESGRMTLKDEEFSFRSFLDQINVMINGQCEDKGLTYECHIVGQTTDYYVGDDMKLKQVLINILGNSVKFTDAPGTVTFSIEQIASFEGMCTLRFTMADTGIGMDADYLPTIFEAFSQEDATTTNSYGGSGLGMAISKNIVEMMNGEIAVESEKGVGTTFTVTVTLKASSRNAHDRRGDALPDDLRALVVDDDEVACEHAKLVLSDLGIAADTRTDAHAALQLLKSQREAGSPYQLLLTDYLMPDMDGIQLTRRLREFDDGETIVMVLTGYSFDDAADEAWEAGASSLLNKPLFTDVLLREIRSALRKREDAAANGGGVGVESETETAAADGAAAAPGVEADAATVGADTPESADQMDEMDVEALLEGRRVLLAEDIEINAEIMMDLLDMEEVQAERAENGQVAVDMFAASEPGHFDAVLMDVRMPVMDGLQAASAIRKLEHPDAQSVPIIALTANAFDEDVQRSLQAGMNAHLSKPVEPDRLYETLAKFIAKREG